MVLCGVEVYGGLNDPPVWPGTVYVHCPLHLCVHCPLQLCVHCPLQLCVHCPSQLCVHCPSQLCVHCPLQLCVHCSLSLTAVCSLSLTAVCSLSLTAVCPSSLLLFLHFYFIVIVCMSSALFVAMVPTRRLSFVYASLCSMSVYLFGKLILFTLCCFRAQSSHCQGVQTRGELYGYMYFI